MSSVATTAKSFEPGTTGWTADDLDEPDIEGKWLGGAFEIIEGVLTRMPPAYFVGSEALLNLVELLKAHLRANSLPAAFGSEADIILSEARVLRPDMIYMTQQDKARQAEAARGIGKLDPRRARLCVPPTLVIESLSPGHEQHDERTKRKWYAEFGVPNYWPLNAFDRTLRCLVLEQGAYRDDAIGRDTEEVKPSAFPGLVIPLAKVWPE